LTAPVTFELALAKQTPQTAAPTDDWLVPAGQLMQLEAPMPDWKEPAAHNRHDDERVEGAKLPLGQGVQTPGRT
jgi:hypothetical protein